MARCGPRGPRERATRASVGFILMNPTPIDVLRARRAGADDQHRVALVVEGGCMRGVISAGALTALEHLRLAERFDAVYGVSAGALGGAYMLAGQAALGTSIYFDD